MESCGSHATRARDALTSRRAMHVLRALCAIALFTVALFAHVPHDVVNLVRVSPAFADDGTLFAMAQLTDHSVLLHSTDGGRSFTVRAVPMQGLGVTDLVFSPDFAADATLFVSTSAGGLWRSTDGGASWQPLSGLPEPVVNDVALSPEFAVDGLLAVAGASGVYLSADRGDTWSAASAGLTELDLARVAFAPDDPAVLLAAGSSVHRSDDGAASWLPLAALPFRPTTLALSSTFAVDGTALAGFGRSGGGLWVSPDGGASFAPAASGPDDPQVNEIAVAADGSLLAVTALQGCFRASDPDGPWLLGDEGFEALSEQTTDHFRSLDLSPDFAVDRIAFVAAFEGLFMSEDGGASWLQVDVYDQRFSRRLEPSPAFATDRRLFVSNYGGGAWVWRDDLAPAGVPLGVQGAGGGAGPPGGGASSGGASAAHAGPAAPSAPNLAPDAPPLLRGWAPRARALTELYDGVLAVSPDFAADRTLFWSFVGLWRSTNAGHTWEQLPFPAFITRCIAVSPQYAAQPTLFLGTGGHGTFRSDDAGETWNALAGGLPADLRVQSILLAPGFPSDARVWLASADAGLWRSPDGGASWAQLPLPVPAADVRAAALAPDASVLLAGTAGSGLWRSSDGGDSWDPAWSGLPSEGAAILESLAFAPDFPADPAVFAVDFLDGVHRSVDGGSTWSASGSGLPPDAPRTLALSPAFASDRTAFLSTYGGVYRSRDGGHSWHPLPAWARVDERHHAVHAEGTWDSLDTDAHLGAGLQRSSERGATQSLGFHGRRIAWHAVRTPSSGRALVRLDGAPVQVVDLYAPEEEPARVVFAHEFGASGWHAISIEVLGEARPASLGTDVTTDGFERDGG